MIAMMKMMMDIVAAENKWTLEQRTCFILQLFQNCDIQKRIFFDTDIETNIDNNMDTGWTITKMLLSEQLVENTAKNVKSTDND